MSCEVLPLTFDSKFSVHGASRMEDHRQVEDGITTRLSDMETLVLCLGFLVTLTFDL